MASVTSASTVAEIEAAFIDYGRYVETASVADCRAFITACRAMLIRLPSTTTKGANSLSFNLDNVRQELEAATKWLAARSTDGNDLPGPARTLADMRGSR